MRESIFVLSATAADEPPSSMSLADILIWAVPPSLPMMILLGSLPGDANIALSYWNIGRANGLSVVCLPTHPGGVGWPLPERQESAERSRKTSRTPSPTVPGSHPTTPPPRKHPRGTSGE